MSELLIILGLGLVGLVFVLPVVAFVRSARAREELDHLRTKVDELGWEIGRLRERIERAGAPTQEQAARSTPAPAVPPQAGAAPAAAAAAAAAQAFQVSAKPSEGPGAFPPEPARAPEPRKLPPVLVPPPLPRLEPEAPQARPAESRSAQAQGTPPPAERAFDWETFMGAKLYAWLGGLALFLAAAYFIKYSFERNLIPPAVRAALGFLLGVGLVLTGWRMKRRAYVVTSQTLCATGVVILYAVTFACRAFYHFPVFGLVPTFLVMSGITVGAFLLAVRLEAQVVAILGMLGGFLTPALLSTGQDNPPALFSYVGLLDVGLMAVALARPWPWLVALAALGTLGTETAWAIRFFGPAKLGVATVVLVAFDALFLGGSEVARRKARVDRWWNGAAAGLALTTFLYALGFLEVPGLAARPGVLGMLVLGADLCLLSLALRHPAWSVLHLAAGALAHLFLASWAMQFMTADQLGWMLGGVMVFALLHSVFPVILARCSPEAAGLRTSWAHLFPLIALGFMFVPLVRLPEVSFFIWLVILAVDALAIAVAAITGALLSILAALALTALVAAVWIFRVPGVAPDVWPMLGVVGGMAAFFLLAGLWALQRALERAEAAAGESTGRRSAGGPGLQDLAIQLPAAAGLLPFLLLVLVTLRLPLTNPAPVFGLGMVLLILLLGVARVFRQPALGGVALVSVLLLEYVWQLQRFDPSQGPGLALLWHAAFGLLFLVFPFISRKQFEGLNLPWIVAAVSLPLHFPLYYRVVKEAWPNDWMGFVPAAAAVPLLLSVWQAHRWFPCGGAQRDTLLAWLGGAALFFITAIFPVQLERQWITVGWALEGLALCWLFQRVPHPGLRRAGAGLLATTFVRLAFNPAVLSYHPRAAFPIWNWYLYAYGVTLLCLFAAGRLLAPPRDRLGPIRAPVLLHTLGTILAFLLVNLEIADYFTKPGEAVLTFRFSGNFARDMSYTVAWAVFALGMVILGIRLRLRPVRFAGLALLGVAVLKLFLHDLAHLNQLYRIGALASVAVIAILASFLYQKFLAGDPRREAGNSRTGGQA